MINEIQRLTLKNLLREFHRSEGNAERRKQASIVLAYLEGCIDSYEVVNLSSIDMKTRPFKPQAHAD